MLARGATPAAPWLLESATSQWGWGFHTVRGSIDQGDFRFRARVCRSCGDLGKYFGYGDGALSSPGEAGSRHGHEAQLLTRAGFISLNQSAASQWA